MIFYGELQELATFLKILFFKILWNKQMVVVLYTGTGQHINT